MVDQLRRISLSNMSAEEMSKESRDLLIESGYGHVLVFRDEDYDVGPSNIVQEQVLRLDKRKNREHKRGKPQRGGRKKRGLIDLAREREEAERMAANEECSGPDLSLGNVQTNVGSRCNGASASSSQPFVPTSSGSYVPVLYGTTSEPFDFISSGGGFAPWGGVASNFSHHFDPTSYATPSSQVIDPTQVHHSNGLLFSPNTDQRRRQFNNSPANRFTIMTDFRDGDEDDDSNDGEDDDGDDSDDSEDDYDHVQVQPRKSTRLRKIPGCGTHQKRSHM